MSSLASRISRPRNVAHLSNDSTLNLLAEMALTLLSCDSWILYALMTILTNGSTAAYGATAGAYSSYAGGDYAGTTPFSGSYP